MIGESFSFLVSFNSDTSLNPNNRIGFLFDFDIISFTNRILLMNQFFVSFGKCRNIFLFSLKIVRVRKPFFFNFLIFFFNFLKMGSKSESSFRGEPKGSSVSIPQTVKKQKSCFCLFFFIGSLEKNFNLDLCQGCSRKGNRIFI